MPNLRVKEVSMVREYKANDLEAVGMEDQGSHL